MLILFIIQNAVINIGCFQSNTNRICTSYKSTAILLSY